MPFKEGVKMRFSIIDLDKVKAKLEVIFLRYGCKDKLDEFVHDRQFFELKGKYNQIFMFNSDNNILLNFINNLISINFHPYSVGVPIVVYNDIEVLPTLAFGSYLVNMCKNKIVIKDYNLLYKLIYKKPIYMGLVYNLRDAIAVDNLGNFIAYVKIFKNRRRGLSEIIPTKDIGWYLRRGG
ncbi:hypothetical protein V6M85_11020 [Sulfolobus tengchongensis]|uniref:Uncharacterized protein n=1 Tax=Sulfolobus tengchongensis TaxID=207809 RepID=A0AAX4L054_9CREN